MKDQKTFAFDLSSTQIQPNTRDFELFEGNTNSSTKITDILIFSYKTSSENVLIIHTENIHGSPEDICHIITDAFSAELSNIGGDFCYRVSVNLMRPTSWILREKKRGGAGFDNQFVDDFSSAILLRDHSHIAFSDITHNHPVSIQTPENLLFNRNDIPLGIQSPLEIDLFFFFFFFIPKV
jgi:hypothetical protein